MTNEEFRALMALAREEAHRLVFPPPVHEPGEDLEFELRTQHAEFGASAH
ncbi:hypothetical protein DWB77_00258 [Streptomyces hundungensis]|uniref:Uncharacterized protein n=1 Tax=Streptomyces hundungensis TaxID=1077946 RepID=A0A387H6H8_9ACTN|nr:hypothetical protein [Streptomyces hundungensis]AYG78151.1 hypothetical protein DWB77_00258 [Streptomyces hundungensis]